MRTLERLGYDVARWHLQVLAVPAREWFLNEHPRDRVKRLIPYRPLVVARDAEAIQLRGGRGLPRAEPYAPIGDQVKGGNPLCDTCRMVVRRRELHDSMAEPDAARSLAGRTEEDLRRGRMTIFLQKMVLNGPEVINAQPVS